MSRDRYFCQQITKAMAKLSLNISGMEGEGIGRMNVCFVLRVKVLRLGVRLD